MRPNMSNLPKTGFVRLSQIVGDMRADPPMLPIIPISKSSWWAGVKEGRYPTPLKLSPRVTVWRVEDIREVIERPPE
jgi:prophage regulatory protein